MFMWDRPVLYLDLDDTLVSWGGGRPHGAPGAHEFICWALERFEVRWLTTWCPGGEMEEKLLGDLAKMLQVKPATLAHIRGAEWHADGSKVNGVTWLEHTVLGRPFIWLEDDFGFRERERAILEEHGVLGSYWHCNVTEDAHSLIRVHAGLQGWLSGLGSVAA